ncbi:replication initiator protein A [Deinococcus altitudinis]|uniref:replication initiator protein A n=1 Tax=Deinococcus altitudinis TaxID=468914 RepID=UPI0038914FE0
MARQPTKSKEMPRGAGELTQFDETNLSRLGLISIQERIPDTYTTWVTTFDVNGHDGELSCFSPSEVGGVPHGLDGDFVTALNAMYLEQGAPPDGYVHTTAYALIQRAGFEDSGQNYERLQVALKRLRAAQFKIAQAWRRRGEGATGWVSVEFSYISQIRQSTPEGRTLTRGTTLSLQLADPVAESIRNRYLHPLDLDFLTSLRRPLARALYRLLNSRRYNEHEPLHPAREFSVLVSDWARDCKLTETVPARIRRNLLEAHEELITRRFLTNVVFEGRGKAARFTYLFGDAGSPEPEVAVMPDSPLVVTLVKNQVARNVAVKLVKDFGEDHVTRRLIKFEALLNGGYQVRQRAALLVDVIKDQDGKYPEPVVAPTVIGADVELQVVPTSHSTRAGHSSDSEQEAQAEAAYRALPLAEQAAVVISGLKMLMRNAAGDGVLARIQASILAGHIDGRDLMKQASRAASELKMQSFVEDLRQLAGRDLTTAAVKTARR